jgi:hypothetical protein
MKMRSKGIFRLMRASASALVLAGFLILPANTNAGPITTISFDDLQTGEDVLNYYNGGLGSLGSGPGPSLGVIFSPGWIVSPPDVYDGEPGGKSAYISGAATMDVPAGWSGPVSFYYFGGPLVVDFYSDQGGTGSLVQTLSLPGSDFFDPAGNAVPFFESAVFKSSGDRIDALTNGALVIPEPSTFQLFLLGILGIGAVQLTALRWNRR